MLRPSSQTSCLLHSFINGEAAPGQTYRCRLLQGIWDWQGNQEGKTSTENSIHRTQIIKCGGGRRRGISLWLEYSGLIFRGDFWESLDWCVGFGFYIAYMKGLDSDQRLRLKCTLTREERICFSTSAVSKIEKNKTKQKTQNSDVKSVKKTCFIWTLSPLLKSYIFCIEPSTKYLRTLST